MRRLERTHPRVVRDINPLAIFYLCFIVGVMIISIYFIIRFGGR